MGSTKSTRCCPAFLFNTSHIPQILPNWRDRGRYKASGNKIVFEDVSNPLSVALVGFLPPNRLHVFGVGKDNVAGGFQNIVDGNPILPGRFHTHIFAMILGKPACTPAQISGESGEPLAFVSGNAVVICGSDTSDNKGFVDIHSATDRINDFKHNTSPRNSI